MSAGREGISRLNPSWSYVFIRSYASNSMENYVNLTFPTRGPNFNSTIEQIVSDIVNKYETGDICMNNFY